MDSSGRKKLQDTPGKKGGGFPGPKPCAHGKPDIAGLFGGENPQKPQNIFFKKTKSSVGDLRQLFARTIALRDIAEPLASFDHGQPAAELRVFMEQRNMMLSDCASPAW